MSESSNLEVAASQARERLDVASKQKLALDLTRGKPAPEQLDLSLPLLELLGRDPTSEEGQDCRNYGGLEGLPEARALFAEYLEVRPSEILVQGNSSLRLMFDVVSWCHFLGTGSGPSWSSQGTVKILCPTPGYDRHFHLLEHLGIEMIPVAMDSNGPMMDEVQSLVAEDASVKGIFCVPRFSNPTGAVYSQETVQTLAQMPTAAVDFRILWDNAYAHHALAVDAPTLMPLIEACKGAGNPERAIVFGSTSKITFAGGGLAFVATAGANQAWLRDSLSKQCIGPNKIEQLAHVRFFEDLAGIEKHMRRHAELLAPKFSAAIAVLEDQLGKLGIAHWTKPKGGYFISVDTMPGCASRTVQLAAEVGVKLTPAGATSPYGRDPFDRNIRLAPSFPSVEAVVESTRVLADSIIVATWEEGA